MSNTHVPRRSGATGTERDLGPRQVLRPAQPKRARRARGPRRGPELCGIPHPDLDLTCTAEVHVEEAAVGTILDRLMGRATEPVRIDHQGKHRARPLRGVVIRWSDDEVEG